MILIEINEGLLGCLLSSVGRVGVIESMFQALCLFHLVMKQLLVHHGDEVIGEVYFLRHNKSKPTVIIFIQVDYITVLFLEFIPLLFVDTGLIKFTK